MLIIIILNQHIAFATGTPAGTTISNSATVNFDIAGSAQSPVTSSSATFQVDELIQPVLTWQDAAPVSVNTPGSNDALTFLLTNAGNGPESFSLARTNGPLPLPSGNYTPLNGTVGSIYLENGLQPGFQATGPNADTPYVSGTNDPGLAASAGQIVYVISDTPANIPVNSQGSVLLSADALTAGAAGAAPGTTLPGLGQGGVSAIVGSTSGLARVTGSYITSGLGVSITKTVASIQDPGGTSTLMPNAVVTYQILVSLSGSGTAANLVITDPLPAETSYVPNSITVDGIAKTDAADADNAQFSANTLTVSLGNVAAPANIVINFRATIN